MAFAIDILSTISSDFSQIVELDLVNVTVRLKFNTRDESWFMSLETENTSIKDIRLSINFPLLKQHKAIMYDIPGDFFVIKINESAIDNLTYANLGNDYQLLYLTEEEVTAWYSANNII